ncbi:MAG: hypothetical protein JO224_13140 [Pelomonas sp.]|nr:hypothetical protein [Roseateles sp.]
MIIPLHLLPEDAIDFGESPGYTVRGQAVDPQLLPAREVELASPLTGPVAVDDLLVLQAGLQALGHDLSVPRMLYDRLYACDRLAWAYAHGGAPLRELALSLYDGYERAGEWIGLIH